MKPEISIVIPSHNTKNILKDCITSIYKTESDKNKFEIVLVDNASSDGTVDMVKSDFPKVKVISNSNNLGFAKAVNQGWKKSDSELVLFLNSDTVFKSKNIIEGLVKYLSVNDNVGALSGKLILRNGKHDPDTHRGFPDPWSSFAFFIGLEKVFPKSKIFARYHMGWQNLGTIHDIDAGCGAFLVVRKKILKELNGWDEDYFFYGEDIDLCYRIKSLGWKIMYYPNLEVMHYKGASSGLRKESGDVAKTQKETLIKVAGASVEAWQKFYEKFYKGKYPSFVTYIVLLGIRIKGFLRITKYKILR
ncbi:MAG: WsbD [Candidatus Woesebacteria bacterium GW2011_GWA1_37_8]|uniref:WsbD n=2 Tax=Candidatus Woeseibacteriota TaxID=1752722 RepID=A0A0G0L903_9BACT|nr:MAG: hypothetical protein US39_C0009G0010 [Microgenomates group bacterium GW2011_GWC1_37_12b]KKQ46329.1 MAG: WsbD [Candidatus Woesebacteria bacterium GW2011_GWA1_37_8]KKQ87487.1 MAG: WsbD [Candidatus Woesebacteria bacterium GW2011_GWB1_38_8b]